MIRNHLLSKIEDKNFFDYVILNANEKELRTHVIPHSNSSHLLTYLVRRDPDIEIKREALKQINDGRILYELFREITDPEVLDILAEKIEVSYLIELYPRMSKIGKIKALTRIQDLNHLQKCVKVENDEDILRLSVSKLGDSIHLIEDYDILRYIAIYNEDSYIRLNALSKIKDDYLRIRIIEKSKYKDVVYEAIANLTRQGSISHIAKDHQLDDEARSRAIARLEKPLEIIKVLEVISSNYGVIIQRLNQLGATKEIEDLAVNSNSTELRSIAVKFIKNEQILADIVIGDPDIAISKEALDRIESQFILSDIIINIKEKSLKFEALNQIDNPKILEFIINNIKDNDVRDIVIKKKKLLTGI